MSISIRMERGEVLCHFLVLGSTFGTFVLLFKGRIPFIIVFLFFSVQVLVVADLLLVMVNVMGFKRLFRVFLHRFSIRSVRCAFCRTVSKSTIISKLIFKFLCETVYIMV